MLILDMQDEENIAEQGHDEIDVTDYGEVEDVDSSVNLLVPYQNGANCGLWQKFKKRVAQILLFAAIIILILVISLVINFLEDLKRSEEHSSELCHLIQSTLEVAKKYLRDHGKRILFRLLPLHLQMELRDLVVMNDCSDEELSFSSINHCCN